MAKLVNGRESDVRRRPTDDDDDSVAKDKMARGAVEQSSDCTFFE
jgi:hypothetical protein